MRADFLLKGGEIIVKSQVHTTESNKTPLPRRDLREAELAGMRLDMTVYQEKVTCQRRKV